MRCAGPVRSSMYLIHFGMHVSLWRFKMQFPLKKAPVGRLCATFEYIVAKDFKQIGRQGNKKTRSVN